MSTPVRNGAPTQSAIDSIYMQLMHLLPKNSVSRGLGELSDLTVPEGLRELLYGIYAAQFGLNVDEAELPLAAYPSFNAFFTRALKPGLRPVDTHADAVVSPVDGTLSEFGAITGGELTQTKGRMYHVEELVGSAEDAAPFLGGSFMTIYLHPRDYHRIHFPIDGRIAGYRYEPGHLFPVNAPSVASVDRLFCVNERVTVFMDTDASMDAPSPPRTYNGTPAALTMVGATCVGRMTLAFDDLVSNKGGDLVQRVHYQDVKPFDRADEMGAFNLGSTVILLFGEGAFEPLQGLVGGQTLRLGERIGTLS